MSFIAKPFGILIKYIYNYLAFDSYGLAIILFTIFARLLLFPLNLSQQRSMDKQQAIMPEMEALKQKYGNDKNRLQQEQQMLYSKYNINPMAGCLPLLLQFPLLMALYEIIRNAEVYIGESVNKVFLGIFDLSKTPEWKIWTLDKADYKVYLPLLVFPIVAFATTYISQMLSMKKNKKKDDKKDETPNPMNGMMKIMPFMTLIFGFMVPAGLALYWAVGNILSILQTYLIKNVFTKKKEGSVKNA
ncbi:MAG: membrane protein insertase YidC [Clostridia bacterium]|nr:membrane protein insertase YidC [Clostridia bacterium]